MTTKSPVKNIASRYLDSLGDDAISASPLRPKSRAVSPVKYDDLDSLARELNADSSHLSPSKRGLSHQFGSPSATVSSFKSSSHLTSPDRKVLMERTNTFKSPSKIDTDRYQTLSKFDHSPTKWSPKTPSSLPTKNATTPIPTSYLSRTTPGPKTPASQASTNATALKSNGYEYLCRIQCVKEWFSKVLNEDIDHRAVELIDYIRNGIYLAKLANFILPTQRKVFTNDSKLQFKHTENINRFFDLLDFINIPDLFRFELTDLYDAKNLPKVWLCLYAMSYILHQSNPLFPQIQQRLNYSFSDEDIATANRALHGKSLPNFTSIGSSGSHEEDGSAYMNKVLTGSPKKPVLPTKLNSPIKVPDTKVSPFLDLKTTSNAPLFSEIPPSTITRPTLSADHSKYSRYLDALVGHTHDITKLQSLCRGANFRYRMFVDRIILKSVADELTMLLSKIRGNLLRNKSVHLNRAELLLHEREIVRLQSIVRANILKSNKLIDVHNVAQQILLFQSAIRGQSVRRSFATVKGNLNAANTSTVQLQSTIRMRKVYLRSAVILKYKDSIEPAIISIQSLARRFIFKRRALLKTLAQDDKASVSQIVAIARGQASRKMIAQTKSALRLAEPEIHELQCIAKGAILRSHLCNALLFKLFDEDEALSDLCAVFRGNKVRSNVDKIKAKLRLNERRSILPIQTRFRGILCRAQKEFLLDDLYHEIASVVAAQSLIRGYIIRRNARDFNEYYKANTRAVIKAQAYIRSYFARVAYMALINLRNPPLSAVARFAYLLTDDDTDYQEEMELNEINELIVAKSKNNKDLDTRIEHLDVKLQLLDKNKISVDDFLIQHNKPATKSAASATARMKASLGLSQSCLKRIELYESLFYLLQTKPIYFQRLFCSLNVEKKSLSSCQNLQTYIMQLFAVDESLPMSRSRQEYYLIKLIVEMMNSDLESNCQDIRDLTNTRQCFWIDYFVRVNNTSPHRAQLKSLLGNFVSSNQNNTAIDFESDPSCIYQSISEEKGNASVTAIPALVAIKEPNVSERFVKNLMDLREAAGNFLLIAKKPSFVERVPMFVRQICRHAYLLSKSQDPGKQELQHLSMAGVVFSMHYISGIMINPREYGLGQSNGVQSHRAQNNLTQLTRVVLQLFSLRPFSDNFLKPLNDFMTASFDDARNIISDLIQVRELEHEYKHTDYDDFVEQKRPVLTMLTACMVSLEKMIKQYLDVIAPGLDDSVYNIFLELALLKTTLEDYVSLTELGALTLNLNPAPREELVMDSSLKTTFTQLKRCMLYIMRIQSGDSILDLLISPITAEHEKRFKEMVLYERQEVRKSGSLEKRRPYYKASLGDLSKCTFHDLKKMALELLLKLEDLKQATRQDSFQVILDMIATDIRTKDTQRNSRKIQLQRAAMTLAKMDTKERVLKKQLLDYNRHIDTMLEQLQLKPKDKKLFNIIPVFSKQYFYQRELRKQDRLPRFGSYKYSAKKLMDQKIILSMTGQLLKSFSELSKLDIMFSCHRVGHFIIEASTGLVTVSGAHATISLDQLLSFQQNNVHVVDLFDNMAKFDTQRLTAFIFRKFYDLNKTND